MVQMCRSKLLGMCLVLLLDYVSCKVSNGIHIGMGIGTETIHQAMPYQAILTIDSPSRYSWLQ